VKTIYGVVGVAIIGVLFAGVFYNQGWFNSPNRPQTVTAQTVNVEADPTKARRRLEKSLGVSAGELVEVGGVLRPKRDLQFDQAGVEKLPDDQAAVESLPNPGRAIQLVGNENPQVRQVFEEAQSPDTPLPNRMTRFQPEPFDRAAYNRDPEAYLNKVVPGRIFQTAQPGPDVTPIAAASRLYHRVIQGEAVTLEVHVDPLQPVSWHTQAAGEFDSRLTTYTTAADENGVARARYLATTGTMGLVNIIASSPVHSEQIEFVVNVTLPANAGSP
jgi:hypothetical protein